MYRRIGFALLVAAALAQPAQAKAPKVGEAAPEARLTLLDGSTIALSQLRGQVVVLNFWATWCGPCRKELPTLDGYYRAQSRHGLRVFAVTTEGSVPLAKLKPLFAALSISPVRGIGGPYRPIRGAVPTNYVVDRRGIVRYAAAGAFDLDALNRILVPLLRESAPPS